MKLFFAIPAISRQTISIHHHHLSRSIMTTDPKIQLLSHAVSARPDGEYGFGEKALLIPHECLRREMNYMLKAVQHLDPVKFPWKAHCFHEWLTKFFYPSIHGHHDLEEHCFFLYYEKLGASVPPKMAGDHKTLMAELNKIVDTSRQLLELVVLGGDNGTKLSELVQELRMVSTTFVKDMDEHLNEEEAFWPSQIERYGEKEYQKCESKIIAYGQKHEGKSFETLAAAVIYATGSQISNVAHHPDDTWWAGPNTRTELLNNFPYPVRALLLPSWNKRYQRFKTMIHSVCGDTDILHVQDQRGGCTAGSCIIA